MRHVKTALALTLALTLLIGSAGAYTVKSVNADELFTDELLEHWDASPWAQEEVYKAQLAGLTTLHTDSGFTDTITRFQFAELVSNLLEVVMGSPLLRADVNTFPDTKEDAVLKAANTSIVTGLPDGTFGGDKLITRQEICVMLDRAVTYLEDQQAGTIRNSKDAWSDDYTDWDQVGDWASNAVLNTIRRGVVNGTSKTTVSPLGNTTVEQAIIMVYRLYVQY